MTPEGQAVSRPPRALVVACVLGAVGALVLLVGAATGSDGVAVAGLAFGCGSLGAALAWRSALISSWRASRGRGGPARPPGAPRTPG